MCIAICDDSTKALKLLGFNSFIKFIILFDHNLSEELKQQAEKIGVKLLTFEEVKQLGRCKIKPVQVNIFKYLLKNTKSKF